MISVVIPYYNCIEGLEKLLNASLLDSKLVSEIVIVDDGSDVPLNTILNSPNPKIKIYTQPNQGPGVARKKGLSFVSSHYVHFMDADDELSPNFYESFEKYLTQDFECLCANVEFVESGNGPFRHRARFAHSSDVYSGEDFAALLLQSKVPTFYQNKVFSVAKLEKNLMNDERINEDVSSIWRHVLGMKQVKVVHEATLFYVQTSGSIMRSYEFTKNFQRINAFRWIEATVSCNEKQFWNKFRNIYFNNIVLLGAFKMQWNSRKVTGIFSLLILLAREIKNHSIPMPTNILNKKIIVMTPIWLLLKIVGRLLK